MATISITISDAIATRVVNAVVYSTGYTDIVFNMDGISYPNPITKTQWAKNVLKQYIKGIVVSYEANLAGEQAKEIAKISAETDIIIED